MTEYKAPSIETGGTGPVPMAPVSSVASMESHFRLVIYLMLFFFLFDFLQCALVALHKIGEQFMPDLANTTWKPLFFIALGMFRGMEAK